MTVETVSVEVKPDHILRLCRVKKPILAVAELVWNALDADATEVHVELEENQVGGLERIRVIDDGHGLQRKEAAEAFGSLGGSWKHKVNRTRQRKRLIHGRMGKGRFRAFALGRTVEWRTRFDDNGGVSEYTVIGKRMTPDRFDVGDPAPATKANSGTAVEVRDIETRFPSLTRPDAAEEMAEYFALYMTLYPDVRLFYQGKRLDPRQMQVASEDYRLSAVRVTEERSVDAVLTIIEWKEQQTQRKLFLCDGDGLTLEEITPGIQARGFQFTAYLKSEYVREMDDENMLCIAELHPGIAELVNAAKDRMREHFRLRAAEVAIEVVEEWKRDRVYPYEGEAKNPIERAERQVFDICALDLNTYLAGFDESDVRNKKLAFRLLRHALSSSPSTVAIILREILDLPANRQEELARLIEKTSLEAMINASRTVVERLDFLQGLEVLVFDRESKKALLERRQLHQILSNHAWVFGEEFHLTVSDSSLTEVLRRHLEKRGSEVELLEDDITEPVTKPDGTRGIIDLMFSCSRSLHPGEVEHLVVELKRPSIKLGHEEMDQVCDYAFGVAEDDRFRDTKTRWVFWLVGNEMSAAGNRRVRQRDKPPGLLHDDPEKRIVVWAKGWGEIIQECKGRLHFFEQQLGYRADRDSGLEYLRETYAKYLPGCVKKEG